MPNHIDLFIFNRTNNSRRLRIAFKGEERMDRGDNDIEFGQ